MYGRYLKKMAKRKFFLDDGTEVKSNLEKTIGNKLIKRGIGFEYEKESYKWSEYIPRAYCDDCGSNSDCYVDRSYTPDYFLESGTIIEVKGKFTAKDRKIAAAMKEQHPNLKIAMLFSKDNYLTKQHGKRYSDWCNSKGIEWSLNELKEEWL